jgi:HAD superfamily hydrolase (TIGR01490 family)
MDRTLVGANTWDLYTRFRKDRGEIGWKTRLRTSFWLAQYAFGVINAEKVAERASLDFGGLEARAFSATLEPWFHDYVKQHIRSDARTSVERHRAAGDVIVIVTAATRFAATPLARELGIPYLVCTELEQRENGFLTGRLAGPVCYGDGKVERTRCLLAELGGSLAQATFYSDSITDLPLLESVGTPVAVCPDRRLSKVAASRGWRIENWV